MQRLDNKQLKNLVTSLLNKGKEGDFWDFKEDWYSKKHELLKDILCFANTVHSSDCYIIIGVTNDLVVKGIQASDKVRYKQADLLDFLSNISFAGDFRPQIYVDTINYDNVELDIITVKDSENVPFYLNKNYGKLLRGLIYSRVGDKNTAIDKNSDRETIVNLWKKQLGIFKPIKQFIFDKLQNKLDWTEYDDGYYYKFNPACTLCIETPESNDFDEYYCWAMCNEKAFRQNLYIKYSQTILDTYTLVVLDSGRMACPIPNPSSMNIEVGDFHRMPYKYYIKNSAKFDILNFLYNDINSEHREIIDHLFSVVPVFYSEDERKEFAWYIENHEDYFLEKLNTCGKFRYIFEKESAKAQSIQLQLLIGYSLCVVLQEWRSQNN